MLLDSTPHKIDGENIIDLERYHQINNRNEEKLTRKQIQAHTRENTKNLYSMAFSLYPRASTEDIFTNKGGEYKMV